MQVAELPKPNDSLPNGIEEKKHEIHLSDVEELTAFRWSKFTNPAGLPEIFDGHAVIFDRMTSRYRLEPLSGLIAYPKPPPAPGLVQWLPRAPPAIEEDLGSNQGPSLEISGLRVLQGRTRAYIFGVKMIPTVRSDMSARFEACTGQTPMFWLDLIVLTFILGLTDWALDWQQLALFLVAKERSVL